MGPFTAVASLKEPLESQIQKLVAGFPSDPALLGLILIGSCSRGEATYRSDVDYLCVLASGPLTYQRVCGLRDKLESHFGETLLTDPLRCEFHFILLSAFSTHEPAMREALKKGTILVDPSGTLKAAQLELRKRIS